MSVCIDSKILKGKRKNNFKSQKKPQKYCLGQETFNVNIHIRTHAVPVLCNYQKIGSVSMGENMKLKVHMTREIMSKLFLFLQFLFWHPSHSREHIFYCFLKFHFFFIVLFALFMSWRSLVILIPLHGPLTVAPQWKSILL